MRFACTRTLVRRARDRPIGPCQRKADRLPRDAALLPPGLGPPTADTASRRPRGRRRVRVRLRAASRCTSSSSVPRPRAPAAREAMDRIVSAALSYLPAPLATPGAIHVFALLGMLVAAAHAAGIVIRLLRVLYGRLLRRSVDLHRLGEWAGALRHAGRRRPLPATMR